MSPKDKAKELYDKMQITHYVKLGGKNSKSKGLPLSMYNTQVKQCALICVDEIIEDLSLLCIGYSIEDILNVRIEYYKEVKQEIENL